MKNEEETEAVCPSRLSHPVTQQRAGPYLGPESWYIQ
jgi:hypothetical protein